MDYKGTIIEESLSDKRALSKARIVSTKVERVAESHRTPWLKQWTLRIVEVSEEKADEYARELSRSIETAHGGAWYIDYKNDKTHFIIFPGKVFKINRSSAPGYDMAREYGMRLGIPEYQLDFSPSIK